MALIDATNRQKRKPGNDRDTMRAKADRVLMADVSANDIKLINKFTNKQSTVDDVRSLQEHSGLGLSTGPQGITDSEIKKLAKKLEKEMGGWIFHARVDFDNPTPSIIFEEDHPEIIKSWIKKSK